MRIALVTLTLIAMVSSVTLTAGAQDDESSGNRLIVKCAAEVRILDGGASAISRLSEQEIADSNYCLGLVRGEADALDYAEKISVPDAATVGQLVRIVEKFLQDHPEVLAKADTVLVLQALLKAFPKK